MSHGCGRQQKQQVEDVPALKAPCGKRKSQEVGSIIAEWMLADSFLFSPLKGPCPNVLNILVILILNRLALIQAQRLMVIEEAM